MRVEIMRLMQVANAVGAENQTVERVESVGAMEELNEVVANARAAGRDQVAAKGCPDHRHASDDGETVAGGTSGPARQQTDSSARAAPPVQQSDEDKWASEEADMITKSIVAQREAVSDCASREAICSRFFASVGISLDSETLKLSYLEPWCMLLSFSSLTKRTAGTSHCQVQGQGKCGSFPRDIAGASVSKTRTPSPSLCQRGAGRTGGKDQ